MVSNNSITKNIFIALKLSQEKPLFKWVVILISAVLLAGCASSAISKGLNPAGDALATVTASPTPILPTNTPTAFQPATATKVLATATATPVPTPSVTAIPPGRFETGVLYRGVEPVSYIEDACTYYHDRWNPENAAPGTIVLPVMYHGISNRGPRGTDNITVSSEYFLASVEKAYKMGFETITMQQMVDFLHHNAYIPPRSLLLIIDDRRLGTVREHILPILKKYDWHLVLAYITGVMNAQEWRQAEEVIDTGRVEMQAHGYMHNGETYITEWTSEEIIRQELFMPIPVIEEHLGYKPIAFIWPGGNYNQLSVDIADEAGYEVAFTVFARGPIMYNWIPLGEADRKMNNPFLVLPRYWSTTLYKNLDFAVDLSMAAQAQAESQRIDEINWYRVNCPGSPPLSFELDTTGPVVPEGW